MSWEVSDLDVSLLDTMTKLEIQLEIYDVILIGYFVPIISKCKHGKLQLGAESIVRADLVWIKN